MSHKNMQGKSIRWTIGRHGHFTPEQVRKIAKEKLYFMSFGIDPNKQEKKAQAKTATLAEVLESYKNIHKNIKDKTRQDYDYYTEKYLHDWLKLRMSDINKNMVVERHAYIGENHGKDRCGCKLTALGAHYRMLARKETSLIENKVPKTSENGAG
jgi:hypothetical protein